MSPAASEKSFRYDAFSTTQTEVLKQELELFWQKSMSPFILGEASTAYLDRTRGDSLVVCNVLLKFLLPGAKIFFKNHSTQLFFPNKIFHHSSAQNKVTLHPNGEPDGHQAGCAPTRYRAAPVNPTLEQKLNYIPPQHTFTQMSRERNLQKYRQQAGILKQSHT